MNNHLNQLLQQEKELQFTHFNEDTAWALGSQLVAYAAAENLPITIDISRSSGHQLFEDRRVRQPPTPAARAHLLTTTNGSSAKYASSIEWATAHFTSGKCSRARAKQLKKCSCCLKVNTRLTVAVFPSLSKTRVSWARLPSGCGCFF